MYRLFPSRSIPWPRLAWVALLAFIASSQSAAAVEPRWKLPPGFTIEQVAGPPLVRHPTMGCFDDRGRLYICDGPGENLYAKDLLAQLPHSIKRLEDIDGDGRFDRVVTFADKMVFPMGALWHDGAVYTASPPHIWRLRDTDDDGVADERTILVSEFGFTGNAADIHGCFLGPDGRLYWCDGRHGHTLLDDQGRTISQGKAARLFSCKLDGSDVQVFAGGGMDNPVEVDFTDAGEPLGTVAIYENRPDRVDALIHWVYGGTYPYAEAVLGEFKKTGPLLPAVRYYGRVAPAGVVRHRSPAWGEAYRDNWFHVQFNTHRMIRTKLTRDGASFRGEDEEFLISDEQDVHLTDVIEDADGSLLVVDTGGWFRIACPNSQIAKPEILGGIYRIRKTSSAHVDDPWGRKFDWPAADPGELTMLLEDERATVRDRAVARLAQLLSSDERPVLAAFEVAAKSTQSPQLRTGMIWALARAATPHSAAALRDFAGDANPRVRQAAARALASLDDAVSAPSLLQLLADSDPAVRRDAASALGRLKHAPAVPALLSALETSAADRMLDHALIYALLEIGDDSQLMAGLTREHPAPRRGALIALDQNQSPLLTRDAVAKLLDTTDARLQRTVLEVMQRHPDWVDGVLGHLRSRLAAASLPDDETELLRDTILAYKQDARVQQIVTDALADRAADDARRRFLLEVIERSELVGAAIPASWIEQVAAHLASGDDAVVRQAVSAATRLGGKAFDPALLQLARQDDRPADLRVAALGVAGGRLTEVEPPLFQFLTARLTGAGDPLDRAAAAKTLALLPLNAAQRNVLLESVARAGALELPPLLEAFLRPEAQVDGMKLVAALVASPGADNVTSSTLDKLLARYSTEVRTAAEPLFKRINADIETQRARLAELTAQMDGGDPKNGAVIFQMVKTACSSCHRIGTRGTAVGPDLTKVGQIRSRADLLEAIVYPSASFVRNYESVAVETDDGRIVTGLLSRETPEALYVRTPQKEEVRILRSAVETIAPGKLSIMPQGLDKIMTPAELRDLIAFLQSLK